MSRLGRLTAETRAASLAFLRRRTAVFFTFFFPLIIVVIFGVLVQTQPGGGGLFTEPPSFYAPGYLAVVVLFTPLSRVGSEVARHRDGNRFEKLATTPLTRTEWLLAQTLVAIVVIGAAALLITSREFAEEHGFEEIAEIGNNAVAGVEPEIMGIGPIPACEQLFERSGTSVDDYDLVELNEAFASQCVYCRDEIGFDNDIYNVNGGAIAIGHPLGATGARLPVTLLHEMHKRDAERGIATECVGFGQGAAIELIVE